MTEINIAQIAKFFTTGSLLIFMIVVSMLMIKQRETYHMKSDKVVSIVLLVIFVPLMIYIMYFVMTRV